MGIDGKTKAIRAVIDCPVCFSGNTFYLNSSIPPLVCDDCGFALTDSIEQIRSKICIFCSNPEFYVNPPLVLNFFAPSLVCYVCEAEYTGFEASEPDKEFDEKTARRLRDSKPAMKLNERVDFYNYTKQMKPVDVENWNRKTIYEYFKDYHDPFFNMTANLDATALYRFCKDKKLSFALANLFYSLQTVNEIRELKIRLKDDQLVEFETIHATMTIAQPDETFSFCYFEMKDNVFEFNEAGRTAIEKYTKLKTFDVMRDRVDLIYSSVIPWVSFTSFKHAGRLNNKFTIPRMVWGKMFDDAGRKKMPHSVEVHHAIADGFHVGKYFVSLQEKLTSDL